MTTHSFRILHVNGDGNTQFAENVKNKRCFATRVRHKWVTHFERLTAKLCTTNFTTEFFTPEIIAILGLGAMQY